jgi:protein-S-isoprenylcysteine O-methyltransferase
MNLTPPFPVLLAGASWLLLGLFYCWQIARYSGRRYVRRTPNYRHLSHLLLACQFGASLLSIGKLQLSDDWANQVQMAGLILMATSLAFCAWARGTLGPFWDKHASIQPDHQLIRNGPYRWCRNPIFLGQFGMFLGVAVLTANWLGLVCCLPALWSFRRRALAEESVLADYFGPLYTAYLATVPRFLPMLHADRNQKISPLPAASTLSDSAAVVAGRSLS